MDINILGPLDVRENGREIRVPTGRERSLLVLLLIHRGEVVSVDRIIDALWGEKPPDTAAKAVQGYVSHLRRLLGDDGARVLQTRSPGYALSATGISVDAARFEQLAAEGRRALDDGATEEALADLDEGLALWRGAALVDFAFDDFAQAEIRRLEELRLGATEDRVESLLRLGRHQDLVGELGRLVAAHPLRERLRGQLMLGLYRCGRQADALETYREGRRLLSGELGLEPGPELQRLERAILAQDSELDAPAQVGPRPVRERPAGDAQQPPSSAWPSRSRVLALVALLALLVVAGALALALTGDDSPGSVAVVPPAVVVVDPKTNRVVESIVVGSKPVSVAVGSGAVWVGDARDGTVTRIDLATHALKTIGIGAPAIDLATTSGDVWVATGGFGTVVRIDARLGAVVDRIDLGGPSDPVVPAVSSIAAGDGRVWVGAFDGLLSIDPGSRRQSKPIGLESAALQIAVGRGAVWATTLKSRVKRLETQSREVTVDFYAGTFVYPLALDGSSVWVAGAGGQLWKLDAVKGSTLLTARVDGFVSSLAVERDALWATLPETGMLVRVDPTRGTVENSIPLGGPAEDIAIAGGLVWVPVGTAEGGS